MVRYRNDLLTVKETTTSEIIKEYAVTVGKEGGIKPLLEMLASTNPDLQSLGMSGLFLLSLPEENAAVIRQHGGVLPLVDLLKSTDDHLKTYALSALSNLTKNRM
jgi:hypothetical protein